jgi:hypothetical protein
MNGPARRAFVIAILAALLPALQDSPVAQDFASPGGRWQGRLGDVGVVVSLERTAPNVWIGRVNAVQDGVQNRALESIEIQGFNVRFGVGEMGPGDGSRVAARFEGEMTPDGARLSGDVIQGERRRPLALDRLGVQEGWSAEPLEGFWRGELEVGAIALRIDIETWKTADGRWIGNLDSPDQGAAEIVFDELSATPEEVRFSIRLLAASYAGKPSASGDEIDGTFTQGPVPLRLKFIKLDAAPVARRPQDPSPPFPYRVEEVSIENESGGVTLAGTLTIPEDEGPHPAAVLISGSGAQDRDETMMGHRPFLVLADRLTRRGIAVLRFDDRGVGGSTGDTMQSTLDDTVGDALAAVEFLKGRREIASAKIGLIGHSEGGWVAPLAAVRSDDVAFIALIAGPGVSGEEILYAQQEAILRAMGQSEDLISATHVANRHIFSILKETPDDEEARRRIEGSEEAILALMTPAQRAAVEAAQSDLGQAGQALAARQIDALLTPWFRGILTYDPRATLRAVKCPVFAAIGENDLQVPPKQNIPALREALTAGGNADFTVLELPGLNHLLQTSATGLPSEYGRIEETMAPSALRAIGDWIVERMIGGRARTGSD